MVKKKKVVKTVTTTETVRKKRNPRKKHSSKKIKINHSEDTKIEKVLVENFVVLQKVMTDLSMKLDKLTGNISELLEIFEKSAEALSKKDFKMEQKNEDTEKVLEGIKSLAEQNKIIAKGLTLIHEQEKSKNQIEHYEPNETINNPPFPEPRFESSIKRNSLELGEYDSSISSKLKGLKPLPRE